MLFLFYSIRENFNLKPSAHCIDNWVFRLHYRATTLLLVVATILVSSRQYIGEHIKCINDMHNGGFTQVIETFCFFSSTFTLTGKDAFLLDRSAHPGVASYNIGSKDPVRRHTYYQWVPFMLSGQAVMFYLTHILWKKLEGGRMKILADGLNNAHFALQDKEIPGDNCTIPSRDKKQACLTKIRRDFFQHLIIRRSWARWMVICEILNVLNVMLQFYLLDRFLGGQFVSFGSDVVTSGAVVLDRVFPKATKCTFHRYGPSGSIQNHDALCIMALNIINEKIFLFLWFWLLGLLALSSCGVLWRLLTVSLHGRSGKFNRMMFPNVGRCKLWNLSIVMRSFSFSDWLFLKYLAKNMDGLVFRELFLGLAEDVQEHKPPLLHYE